MLSQRHSTTTRKTTAVVLGAGTGEPCPASSSQLPPMNSSLVTSSGDCHHATSTTLASSPNRNHTNMSKKHQKKQRRRKRRIYVRRLYSGLFGGMCLILAYWIYNITKYHQDVLMSSKIASTISTLISTPSKSTIMTGHNIEYIDDGRPRPTDHACDGYKGIYHIAMGDIGGAAGTVFFQFVLGQIIWAEMYGFKPWVYFNNVSYIIYDEDIHGRNGTGVDFVMQKGLQVSWKQTTKHAHRRDVYPGEPIPESYDNLRPYHFKFDGDGVWENYFEPVSDFVPGDKSCTNKPLVTMNLFLITPGIHGFASWAPRGWRYHYLPDYITRPHIPLNKWLEPMRLHAHEVLKRYIKFKPHIIQQADTVNPDCSMDKQNACLGLHIRQSDKAAGRRQIATDEFLPYVEAFLNAGGKWTYLATDSANVIDHIEKNWPDHVKATIRSMGDNVVRSNDFQAVFDIGKHHRTNREILIEILALSKCQFMIHGLSAVTESSIWMNSELHFSSVNLEDPDHVDPSYFGGFVAEVLDGANATRIVLDRRASDWWTTHHTNKAMVSSEKACTGSFEGIFHISTGGSPAGAPTVFFQSIVNQLLYAEQYPNLKPWIMLEDQTEFIYDGEVNKAKKVTVGPFSDELQVKMVNRDDYDSLVYPGPPTKGESNKKTKMLEIKTDGIWNDYFEPVSDYSLGDSSCNNKPIVTLSPEMVDSLNSFAPWSVKAWQYDNIPEKIWKPQGTSLKSWMEPMRIKGNYVVRKYFRFHPFLLERADSVNPRNESSQPCLAVHFQNSEKPGRHRKKFPPNKLRDYIIAYARAGGKDIYIAADTRSTLEFIEDNFPSSIRKMIRTSGPYVVRAGFWPIHKLEPPHRTISEVLVDILAMSKCQLLLHGHSAVSEAAIYLNLNLHNQSVNWEDPDRIPAEQFEILARKVLGTSGQAPVEIIDNDDNDPSGNVTIISGDSIRTCRKNAIIYLAQKKHSSYGRDSYGILLQSLELMNKNYLSQNNHRENADVIIFHTSDFTNDDMDIMEKQLGKDFKDTLHFVDLTNTTYWKLPHWHKKDNPLDNWYAFPLFSEGYRRMMHWFAIDIWDFFKDYSISTGCQYEYIMRFDEDSFLHSPIEYDIFDFMKSNDYNYGYRLCAYEMQVTQRIWTLFRRSRPSWSPVRDVGALR